MITAGEVLMLRGELRGQRRVLSKLLTLRFGPLPEWATEKLDGASSEQLDVWVVRILTAGSLEESLG